MTHAINTDQKHLTPLNEDKKLLWFMLGLMVTTFVLTGLGYWISYQMGYDEGTKTISRYIQLTGKEADCLIVTTEKNDHRVPLNCLHFHIAPKGGASK